MNNKINLWMDKLVMPRAILFKVMLLITALLIAIYLLQEFLYPDSRILTAISLVLIMAMTFLAILGPKEIRNRPVDKPMVVKLVGVNEPCPCGSGKKYKKCCLLK